MEFFVDTVSGYNADLLLFPELFNAPLMARYNQADPPQAMRSLAKFTTRLRNDGDERGVIVYGYKFRPAALA